MSPTTRNECMALTSCEKRAMKKVGYQIFVYKIIPLSIAGELPKFFYKQSIFDPRSENCLSFSKKSPPKIV